MARVSLNCACGWTFSIPDTKMGRLVHCARCGEPIRVPAPKGHQVIEGPPAQVAAEKERQRRLLMVSIYALVGVAVLIGVIVVVSGTQGVPEEKVAEKARKRNVFTPSAEEQTRSTNPSNDGSSESGRPDSGTMRLPGSGDSSGSGRSDSGTMRLPDSSEPEARTGSEMAGTHRRVDFLIHQTNLAGLLSEFLRFSGDANARDTMQWRMRGYEEEMSDGLKKLEEKGEVHPVPTHLHPGDRIVMFNGKNLRDQPKEAVGILRGWLSSFRSGASAHVWVKRESAGEGIEMTLEFPAFPQEMMGLLAGAGITPRIDASGSDATADAGRKGGSTEGIRTERYAKKPIPSTLVAEIDAKIRKLPDYYQACISGGDRERMDALLKEGSGFPDDIEFLKTHMLGEVYGEFAAEQALFLSKSKELAKPALETLAADVVHFKDRNRAPLEGKVESETEESVKIRGKFGSVTIPRDDIARIARGKGAAVEFPAKYEAAKDKVEELVKLLAWCEADKFDAQRDYLAYVILTRDPGNEAARKALRYVKGASGIWKSEAEIRLIEAAKKKPEADPPKAKPGESKVAEKTPQEKEKEKEKDLLYDCDILRDHARMKPLIHFNKDGKKVENCQSVQREVISGGGGHTYWYTKHRADCPVRLSRARKPADADGFVSWVFEVGFSPPVKGGFLWPFELQGSDRLWFEQVQEDLTARLPYIREGARWVSAPKERAGKDWRWEATGQNAPSRTTPDPQPTPNQGHDK